LFIISKIPELVDTVFIVLRNKKLIFLHWYHHITVLLFCWHSFYTRSSAGLYFTAMNYSVHAIMYFYFFLTSMGYKPPWGICVTILQISQMFVGVFVCSYVAYFKYQGLVCYQVPANFIAGIIMYASYFGLFLKLFCDRFVCNKGKKSKTGKRSKKAQKSE